MGIGQSRDRWYDTDSLEDSLYLHDLKANFSLYIVILLELNSQTVFMKY